ncbi:MAG TPA: GAF domain-containing protein [Burkholderiales bacterium]|nr:GAF domain-containing protein [Burkholderiales bacterium]
MNDRAKAARGARSAAAVTTLLQSVCDRLPVGFALFDADLELAAWNPRLAALGGYPRELVKVGTPLESFVRFDAERGAYRADAVDTLTRQRLAALKRSQRTEREQALPDGRILHIASEPVRGVGVLLTYEDVTENRSNEERLRESAARYELALRGISEGFYDWDIANGTIHYSERVRHAVGLSPEELKTPGDWFARIHPDDQPKYRAASAAHFKGETERFECDYRYRGRDGRWRWARQHGVALRDARGRAYRMVGSTGDITELKRVEEALRASEERYALATTAATEGIYEWNPETGSLFLSDQARTFFAVPSERPTPAEWNGRVHPDDFPGYRQALIAHFKGRTANLEHEYRIRDAAGGYRWVLDRGIGLRSAEGRVTRLIGALSDMTQRKLAEIELRRARDEATAALAEQTALRDVLEAISRSAFDLDAVLRTLIEHATRLVRAEKGFIFRLEGGVYRLAVDFGASAEFREFIERNPIHPGRDTLVGRTALEDRAVHIEDAAADPEYRWPESLRRGSFRTMLGVPMIRDGMVVGVIALWKERVEPFTPAQIDLVTTFSNQALIAIENVRLFNETKEALEQQTATAEILSSISGSITDTQPVFDTIVQNLLRLFGTRFVVVQLLRGDRVELAAVHGAPGFERLAEQYPRPLDDQTAGGQVMRSGRILQLTPVLGNPLTPPATAEFARSFGFDSLIAAPLVREERVIGAIVTAHADAVPFDSKQVALIRTFADQAVIAIENARLFNETKEALDQQKASAEVLQVISSSVADAEPVFDKILESCQRLLESRNVGIALVGDDGVVHLAAYKGTNREQVERHYPLPLTLESGAGEAILKRGVAHYPDVEGADVPEYARRGASVAGFKSLAVAPMLWEGRGIGTIFVGREHPGAFSEKEIALLRTFADQAVIAIQNARLFREIQEKSHQLEIADQHKSAFLANMSHELRTPLNAVIGFSEMLTARYFGDLTAKQAEYVNDIHGSGKHLLSLINDILDLSKIEAGRMELDLAEFDLRGALDNALTLVRERAQRGGVTLRLDTDPRMRSFRGDERKLKQVVLNLLSNAVKFTPSGGAVSVVAKQVDGSAEIAVSDTGVGIAPRDQEAIFEAFRQVGTDVTRKREGTGLGLALTRRFVELHGGTIRVESAPGKGSTFTVRLPIRHGE